MSSVAVFAHQGGWDEALLVIGPLVIIGGLLHLANRRLKKRLAELESRPEPGPADSSQDSL
ncbi:MAG: hypothetical protein KJN63_09610 [Acidimicrobiia bacterium]|nr:hypothetical protein [Acidimicrobiia bacterium]